MSREVVEHAYVRSLGYKIEILTQFTREDIHEMNGLVGCKRKRFLRANPDLLRESLLGFHDFPEIVPSTVPGQLAGLSNLPQ